MGEACFSLARLLCEGEKTKRQCVSGLWLCLSSDRGWVSESLTSHSCLQDSVTWPWSAKDGGFCPHMLSGWWQQQGPRLRVLGFSAACGDCAGTERTLGHRPSAFSRSPSSLDPFLFLVKLLRMKFYLEKSNKNDGKVKHIETLL